MRYRSCRSIGIYRSEYILNKVDQSQSQKIRSEELKQHRESADVVISPYRRLFHLCGLKWHRKFGHRYPRKYLRIVISVPSELRRIFERVIQIGLCRVEIFPFLSLKLFRKIIYFVIKGCELRSLI